MQEEWRPIPGFPKYEVSDQGRVRSVKTDHILKPSKNQQGHLKLNLSRDDNKVYTRNLNHLVARSYLDDPPRSDFISVIHLDGDKENCRAANLVWRPRYFAIKYHQQFDAKHFKTTKMAIRDIKTGEVYKSVQEAVVRHGLLFNDILISAHNRTYVWPTYQEFAPV